MADRILVGPIDGPHREVEEGESSSFFKVGTVSFADLPAELRKLAPPRRGAWLWGWKK